MTQFYLIRHGEPEWNINEQYKLKGHGRDLVPLTDTGVNQVYRTAQDERLKEAELIVSSPYPRALQTAAILSKELGNDYDANEGVYPPGGTKLWESKELLKNRVEKVIDRYLGFQKVIITGHGMAFRTLVGEVGEIPHASITEYKKTQAVIETTRL